MYLKDSDCVATLIPSVIFKATAAYINEVVKILRLPRAIGIFNDLSTGIDLEGISIKDRLPT